MNFEIDAYAGNICKAGEEQCGGITEIVRNEKGVSAVLTDGLGNGYRATLLATVMAKILLSFLKKGISIEEAVETVAQTIPVNKERGAAYAAFTIVQVSNDGFVRISEVNTPRAVILRKGKPFETLFKRSFCGGLSMNMGTFEAKANDTVIVFSDGFINAGSEEMRKAEWGRDNVIAYLAAAYKPCIGAEKLTKLLLSVCGSLCSEKPADDVNVITLRVLKRKSVNFQGC